MPTTMLVTADLAVPDAAARRVLQNAGVLTAPARWCPTASPAGRRSAGIPVAR